MENEDVGKWESGGDIVTKEFGGGRSMGLVFDGNDVVVIPGAEIENQ